LEPGPERPPEQLGVGGRFVGTDVGATKAWLGFIAEHATPEEAQALAQKWATKLQAIDPTVTADSLLAGIKPGKFVIKFRSTGIFTGTGATP
jgi:hypothetical protein